ncbi:TrkA family potassium uptake protein [Halobaculum sp. MBLA0147]|uniref:potassium channel family protein n=1 Tax=Halobaculum sp. MBLA0147 TaxID=3079934 RepID=UPI003523FF00
MDDWERRTVQYVGFVVGVVVVFSLVYDAGMSAFEGRPIPFLRAVRVVVETFTTTGYGSDAPWSTDAMRLLVIGMDVTGVVLIFLALPVLVFPVLEEALSTTVPTAVDDDLSDHVVICTHNARAATLISELNSWDQPYVIVEPDRETATELYEDGHRVIHQEVVSVDGLERANLADARAVVADISDTVDTSIVLTAKEIDEDVPVVSVVEEPDSARYHELAGADVVLSPRPLLGESLARKVTTGVSTDLGEAVELGEDFDIVELPVSRGSDLVGSTLAESGIRERTGVNVIGAWFRGDFQSPPPPNARLDGSTVLLVTGRPDQLEELRQVTSSDVRRFTSGETVIVGYGEVGSRIGEALEAADIEHTVIDVEDKPGVDVVGDATDPEVLEAAGVHGARSVVLALPDDTLAEFVALIVRDHTPDTEIVARVEQPEAMGKMYRAGADYVLALASVTGRMTASAVLDDEDVLSPDTQVDVIRTEAPGLVGRTLGDADVRSRTGCTVVAVERNGDVLTDVGPTFRVEAGDRLVIAGTDEGTNRFQEILG